LNLEDLKRIVVDEYGKVMNKATKRYGSFTPIEVRLPRLDDEVWREELLPSRNTMKLYGGIYFPEDAPPFMALNTWAFIRELEELGEEHTRATVRRTLSHELIHYLRRGLSEVEINIESERLVRDIEKNT
jgi:hypothetical protein